MPDNFSVSSLSNRCVKCGLCLPECPTYLQTLNEADSPRGRIAIIDALFDGSLPADATVDKHLDSCLLCRRCEKICPSEVPFAKLMDSARRMTLVHRQKKIRYLVNLISSPKLLDTATGLARWVPQVRGSQWLTQLVAHARRRGRNKDAAQLRVLHPAIGTRQGIVGLFTGCTGKALEPQTLMSAVKLLTEAGYEIRIPDQQTCCGALHAHLGDGGTAQQMEEGNLAAFADPDLDAIVSIATGCGAHLANYDGLPAPHLDICSFLAHENRLSSMKFAPLQARATVHIPCTQENALGGGQAVYSLLELVPELTLLPVQNTAQCCGAAGIYFLTHPETATKLRQPVADQIEHDAPEYLVSSNLGCALHITQGLAQANPSIIHPLTLLAQQLIKD